MAHVVRGCAGSGSREAGGGGWPRVVCSQRAQWRRRGCRLEGKRRGEKRTENMPLMFVTLDVSSNLIGWLNFSAPCRGSQAGHTVRGELCAWDAGGGEREGEGTTADWGLHGAQGRAHCEHDRHVRDAGRREVKRLIEVRRVLRRGSQAGHIRCGGAGSVEAGRQKAAGDRVWCASRLLMSLPGVLMSQCVSVDTV